MHVYHKEIAGMFIVERCVVFGNAAPTFHALAMQVWLRRCDCDPTAGASSQRIRITAAPAPRAAAAYRSRNPRSYTLHILLLQYSYYKAIYMLFITGKTVRSR